MSPRSRGRKPKKSGKSKRTSKRPSPAAGRATAVDPGYSGLRIELPRSPLDDVLLRHVRPDRFGPSHRRVLTASAVLLRAGGPRALVPDIEATGDVHVLRDVYGTRFGVIAGFAYPGGVDPSVCLLGFDASEYLGLAAAGVFDDAESAVAAWREQVGDSTPGVEPV